VNRTEKSNYVASKGTPYSRRKYLFFALAFIVVVSCSGYYITRSARDLELEKHVLTKVDLSLQNSATASASIQLAQLTGHRVRAVCIQGPYQEREGFEKQTGYSVNRWRYEYMLDDAYAWWFFYEDGEQRWIKMPTIKLNYRSHGISSPQCSQSNDHIINLEREGSKVTYHF
jgi:hypothetical protein